MIRCVKCGCSRLDSENSGCVLCGGSPSLRTEPCDITKDTKAKLLAHADHLKDFGVRLEVEREVVRKGYTGDSLATVHLVLFVAEVISPGTLRRLVRYLWDIGISKREMPRLRLDEPEKILSYYEKEKSKRRTLPKRKRPLRGRRRERLSRVNMPSNGGPKVNSRRHKRDTKTFEEENFREQAKTMNMTSLQFRKQLEAHLRRANDEGRSRDAVLKSRLGLLQRILNHYQD